VRFALFMSSPVGRGGRIVLGVGLLVAGIGFVGGTAGWLIAMLGVLPLTLGVINGCILSPILHVPFSGAALRRGRSTVAISSGVSGITQ
jgi:hypothetical protein